MLWQLNGLENLLFRARLCGLPADEGRHRANQVMERLEIADKARDYSWNWSAGETQKFNLALTFVARSPVVMLDEPTSHLDPRTARAIRDFVRDLSRDHGQTVIMSTHYLEEADLLCNRVAVLHEGKVLACDTPAELKRSHAPDRITELKATNYTANIGEAVKAECRLAELLEQFEDVATGQVRLRPKWSETSRDVASLRAALNDRGVQVVAENDVAPTLDDVYFELTREKLT